MFPFIGEGSVARDPSDILFGERGEPSRCCLAENFHIPKKLPTVAEREPQGPFQILGPIVSLTHDKLDSVLRRSTERYGEGLLLEQSSLLMLRSSATMPWIRLSLPRPLIPLLLFLYRVEKYSRSSLSSSDMTFPSSICSNLKASV